MENDEPLESGVDLLKMIYRSIDAAVPPPVNREALAKKIYDDVVAESEARQRMEEFLERRHW